VNEQSVLLARNESENRSSIASRDNLESAPSAVGLFIPPPAAPLLFSWGPHPWSKEIFIVVEKVAVPCTEGRGVIRIIKARDTKEEMK